MDGWGYVLDWGSNVVYTLFQGIFAFRMDCGERPEENIKWTIEMRLFCEGRGMDDFFCKGNFKLLQYFYLYEILNLILLV